MWSKGLDLGWLKPQKGRGTGAGHEVICGFMQVNCIITGIAMSHHV